MTVGEGAASVWSIHAGHLLLLGAWALCFALVYGWGRVRRVRQDSPAAAQATAAPRRGPWLWVAVLASVISGAIHLAVTPEHFEEAALYGWFFLVLTAAQFAWSACVAWRPQRATLLAGAAASALVALLWIATRTVGIPFGPAAGETEPFGSPDIAASAAEVVVAVAALITLASARARRTQHPALFRRLRARTRTA